MERALQKLSPAEKERLIFQWIQEKCFRLRRRSIYVCTETLFSFHKQLGIQLPQAARRRSKQHEIAVLF